MHEPTEPTQDLHAEILVLKRRIVDLERADADRREASDAQLASEDRYRLLADSIPDILYSLDGMGNVAMINGPSLARYGYRGQAIKGQPFLGVVHPDDCPTLIQSFLGALAERREVTAGLQFRIVASDGASHWFELHARARFDGAGNYLGEDGVLRDISDRKRAEDLERQLHHAQKMDCIGRLAGSVAHDFNNMLSVILGHTELAMDQVDPGDAFHQDLAGIQQAAEHSAALTRQLLAFARKQTIAPRDLDLNPIVTGTLNMLRRLIGKGIEVEWRPAADLWPVHMDPVQIDQILANLCVNARDAIAGAGKVTIETGNQRVDEAFCVGHAGLAPGEYVRLVVSDDGCGMDEGTLSHLFEPFFTTKAVGKGTGLGLATVYGIVKQNHGFIDVSSKPGHGTAFRILLPRHVDVAPSSS